MIISAADIKIGAIPRIAFIIAFPFFIAIRVLLQEQYQLWEAISGGLAGLLVFLLAYLVSGKKLGLADVWYSALIGLVLGPWWWYTAMGLACITGVIFILVTKQRQIPFIPFMALGSMAVNIIQR